MEILNYDDIENQIKTINRKCAAKELDQYQKLKARHDLFLNVLYSIGEGSIKISQSAAAYKELSKFASFAVSTTRKKVV